MKKALLIRGVLFAIVQLYVLESSIELHAAQRVTVLDATPRNYAAPYMAPSPWEIPQHCNNLPAASVPACNMAIQLQIPLQQANDILITAGLEATGNMCGFKFTDNFIQIKNNLLLRHDLQQVYGQMVKNFDKSLITDVRVWCKQYYASFGPKSQVQCYR